MAASLHYETHRYGDNKLQEVGVWTAADGADGLGTGHWVIYIHGGAWRDPRVLHPTFAPTIGHLLASPQRFAIAAYASLDYRLSPHPDFPAEDAAADPPPSRRREARHPDHLADVRAALAALQARYGFGGRYLLVGHSAGATLAFQVLMGDAAVFAPPAAAAAALPAPDLALPAAVVGLEGIYDLRGLVRRHGPAYGAFVTGAFGPDDGDDEQAGPWAAASPARFAGGYGTRWPAGRLAVLGWSPDDELVDEPEVDALAAVLGRDGVPLRVCKDLEGRHNAVWEDGRHAARLICEALKRLA